MRKTALIALVLCLISFSALGESLDVKSMSLEELQTVYEQISSEISSRIGEEPSKGYSGVFIGGKNILVGSYTFKCLEYVTVNRWINEESYYKGVMECEYSGHGAGETVLVYIADGAVIEIRGGTVNIQPAMEEWVPEQ